MSANISSKSGKPEMMYVGEKPWHGEGTKLDKEATAAEAITAAGLDWKVTKEPVFYGDKTSFKQIDGQFATVRGDTKDALGVVGSQYTVLQNKDAFSFCDAIVGIKEAIYHTAGALGVGEIIWVLAKLNGIVRIKGDDTIEKYLLLTNRHDGGGSVKVLLTPIRVVCQNTLSAALGEANKMVKLRHTASLGLNVDRVQQELGIVNQKFLMFEKQAQAMAAVQMTKDALANYLLRTIAPKATDEDKLSGRTQNIIEEVSALFENGKGATLPGARGTLWGAYNAVVEYVDYKRATRETDVRSAADNRVKSILFGSGADLKADAWDNALVKAGWSPMKVG